MIIRSDWGIEMSRKQSRLLDWILVLLAGALYVSWAFHLPMNMAPDEYMRSDIPMWIYDHGRLPVGNETELLDPLWGYSYAFNPYLPSLVSVLMMKFAGLFTADPTVIFLSMRAASVIAGMGTVYFSLRTGERFFASKGTKYLFTAMICLLPQFVFVCSYLNNDAFSVFTGSMILYFWICGLSDGWSIKTCIGLGTGIGLLALTYYNAYAYILCSIFVFGLSVCVKREPSGLILYPDFKTLIGRGAVVALTAILLAGWYFIRNAVIYDGDFLGMKTMHACGEVYAAAGYQLSQRNTLKNQGLSFFTLLRDSDWFRYTFRSFFGFFGYMSVEVSRKLIGVYELLLAAGGAAGGCFLCRRKEKYPYGRLLTAALLLVMAIPLALSLWSSYSRDYQAQGRYLLSALPAVAFFASCGYENLFSGCPKKWRNLCTGGLIVLWGAMFAIIFLRYILPFCWDHSLLLEQIG